MVSEGAREGKPARQWEKRDFRGRENRECTGSPREKEEELGAVGARSGAVPCLLGTVPSSHLTTIPIPCPVTGYSIGPWGLPVTLAAARAQSTHF